MSHLGSDEFEGALSETVRTPPLPALEVSFGPRLFKRRIQLRSPDGSVGLHRATSDALVLQLSCITPRISQKSALLSKRAQTLA